jgi:hypothetical protein
MSTAKLQNEFDQSLARSEKVIFMTGTITELQIRKITELVAHAVGALNRDRFEYIEFKPVQSYPLFWAPAQHFGADVIALMRSHQALKQAGQPIPRTVLILPTNKMRPYELLLDLFGLTEDAMVASRTEYSNAEIEAARVSIKPWLISSPLFATGLNFVNPPARLWTTFGYLDVDESQIIQTLNRANRTALQSEVRIYANRNEPNSRTNLDFESQRAIIEGYLQEETEVPGLIDPRLQVERLTYCKLRKDQEKDRAKSLHRLFSEDDIQNYVIVDQWEDDLPKLKDDA